MAWRQQVREHGDDVVAGALAVAMTLELVAWDRQELVAAIPLGLLATVPLALRRRLPLVSFLMVVVGLELVGNVHPGFDNNSVSYVVAFLLALYSLGRHAVGVEARLGVAGLVVTMVLFAAGEEAGLAAIDLGGVAFLLGFVGAPWAAGTAVRLRGDLAQAHEQLKLEQEEATRRAVAEERATIARELHDVVAHAISVSVLQARGARRMLGRDEEQVRRSLDAIEHITTQALGDMRRLLAVLRDTEGDAATSPQPSLVRVGDLVEEVRASGLDVDLVETGEERDVPPGVDLSAYRIVQEALTNVLKHAGAATATVRLDYGPEELLVRISDTGSGGPVTGVGHGLVGIRERVGVVGGDVEAGRGPDGGFVVRARLPYSVET